MGFSGEGVGVDPTENKPVDEARRNSNISSWEGETPYRNLFENEIIGIYRVTPEGRFLVANTRVAQILGYDSADELIHSITNISTQIYADPAQRLEAGRLLKEQRYLKNFEAACLHKDGHIVWVSFNAYIVRDGNGKVLYHEGTSEDITERKLAVDALKAAHRQLNLLGGITRHDILNNVSIIKGYLKIIEMEYTDPDLATYLAKIDSTTNSIKSQIAFTKIYEELGSRSPRWQDVHAIVTRLPVPGPVTMQSELQGLEIFADPMLAKVFQNLLDNSVRHGEHAREIRILSRESEEGLTIEWRDNGIGIPDEEKELIFERGYGKNTGLGLFLGREILLLTNLSIRETGVYGKCARFEINVPKGRYRINTITDGIPHV